MLLITTANNNESHFLQYAQGGLPKSPGEKATNDFREGRRLLLVIYASGKKHIT